MAKLVFDQRHQALKTVYQTTGEEFLFKMWWYLLPSPSMSMEQENHGAKVKLMALNNNEHSNAPKWRHFL